MTPAAQVFLLALGVLVSALVALLLSQVTGMRSDLKESQREHREELAKVAKETRENSDRIKTLEVEHKNYHCQFGKVANG